MFPHGEVYLVLIESVSDGSARSTYNGRHGAIRSLPRPVARAWGDQNCAASSRYKLALPALTEAVSEWMRGRMRAK